MNDFLSKANSGPMYLAVGLVIAFVVAMSVVFMRKAWREGVRTGIDKAKMRRAITSSATFTIVPSLGILMGVVALAGRLGVPIPWLRLSVVGAIQYEGVAAEVGAQAAGLSKDFTAADMTPDAFVVIVTVMTVGIISGALFSLFGLKAYQKKALGKVGKNDSRWGVLLFNAMFIGMVCAFIGSGFADLRSGSVISLIVIVVAAAAMALFTWLVKQKNQKWLESFSLSFSMFLGMGAAIGAALLGVK